ncbi:methyl-accepting chemotaxis protein [Geomonas nitrogeniifigens]|uniref:Methyl-accepting chemotaxis protein n=1 Tax=Geomonas diazotrophica TaxID=2843197 RepID=A0ABX8JK71_9BACT|nr:methyl-accepting chemotaxis protein [Geomonas nitrogeniifigens]QWV98703.1 methyl-accepting chemotaxis protein [Geomonas nitrogeniifigens]QXE87860.1 methyl-accepting chemotaxis protein [Geomonas nitrogeniifigens]
MNLRTKVNLTVVAVFAIAITSLVAAAFVSSSRIMSQMLQDKMIVLARENAANLDTWIQAKLAVVEAGAKDLARHPADPAYISNVIKTNNAAGGFSKTHPGYEDGTVIYSDDWKPPADYDPRKRPWYMEGKKKLKTGLTEPYIAASTGKGIITFISPMVDGGTLVGVYGSDVTLDFITKTVLGVKFGETGYAFLSDAAGRILAHPSPDYAMKKKLQELSPDFSNIEKEFGGKATGELSYRLNGKKMVMSFARVPATGWYLCVAMDHEEVAAPVRRQFAVLALIGALFLVVGLAVMVVFLKRLLAPLGLLCQRVSELAEGEGDLTARIDVGARRDELGELAAKLNTFIASVRGIIQQIADASGRLAGGAVTLTETAGSISLAVEEAAAQSVGVATASEEMAATASDIARNCHLAAQSSREATGTTRQGFSVLTATVHGIRERGELTRSNAEAISSLGERSEQIGAIVATIEDIADQTNLLALNAAIEAARAGEQGRGFAVVADEVRALAERTTRATKEISEMIRAMQTETRTAILSMEQGVEQTERGVEEAAQLEEALRRILEQVDAVTGQVNQIATAAEEQTATTGEISSNIHNVTAVVQQAARGSQQSADTAGQLANVARDLQGIVGRFKL